MNTPTDPSPDDLGQVDIDIDVEIDIDATHIESAESFGEPTKLAEGKPDAVQQNSTGFASSTTHFSGHVVGHVTHATGHAAHVAGVAAHAAHAAGHMATAAVYGFAHTGTESKKAYRNTGFSRVGSATLGGISVGTIVGAAVGGPVGAIVGAAAGAGVSAVSALNSKSNT